MKVTVTEKTRSVHQNIGTFSFKIVDDDQVTRTVSLNVYTNDLHDLHDLHE